MRSARYYSTEPEEFVREKVNEFVELADQKKKNLIRDWTRFIRCKTNGMLPEDTHAAAKLSERDALDKLRQEAKILDYHVGDLCIDYDVLCLNYICSFIDLYGIDGRLVVAGLSEIDERVAKAFHFYFHNDPNYNDPGRVVAVRKIQYQDDSIPRIELEFERAVVKKNGTVCRQIYAGGEISRRVDHIFNLFAYILDNPQQYIIEKGAIHEIVE